ncbi:hypothetical protein FIU97_08095 [Roseivivax sp. THAF40]|uniref:hypothetical protein n=1 Tax=unclassified Roseivivax TaxID=2639302 RepID=UPI0012A958DA|nr:hypothetical protein FIV09_07990 [Roseivivax sp. THAF197b]QFT46527.1 hypothetical protein FIU97_08095 [Roseivivax sp. THAF40]
MACILAVICGPALADVTTPGGAPIPCYCTDTEGDRVELGEIICLDVNGRVFTAQCQMSLNNPMWRELNEGCMSSALDPRAFPTNRTPRPQAMMSVAEAG